MTTPLDRWQAETRAAMYGDLADWLYSNARPGGLTEDTIAHLADHLVAERGWHRG